MVKFTSIITMFLLFSTVLQTTQAETRTLSFSQHWNNLKNGPKQSWPASVNALSENKLALHYALPLLLQRLPQLPEKQRLRLAFALGDYLERDGVIEALVQLIDDPSSRVAYAALTSLTDSRHPEVVNILADRLTSGKPVKPLLVKRLLTLYQEGQADFQSHYYGWSWFAAQYSDATPDDLFVTPLLTTYPHQNSEIKIEIIRALQQMQDLRIDPFLEQITLSGQPNVKKFALWALAYRGHDQGFETLYRQAPDLEPDKSHRRWHRDRYFESMGEAHWWNIEQLVEHYLQQTDATATTDYQYMLKSARNKHLFTFPGMLEKIGGWSQHQNPFLKEIMLEMLGWHETDEDQSQTLNNLKQGIPVIILLISFILAGAVGLLMLFWVFRLLHLKYLVTFFPKSRINNLSIGHVAVQGRVIPSLRGLVEYPNTGELCLFYPGVEKKYPKHRFYIEDKSGHIIVDPVGAVLLSEQRLLYEGDTVYMLANVKLQKQRDKQLKVLGKVKQPQSAFQSLMNWLLKALMGANARSAQSRMLYADPAYCFWIWDNPGQKPLASSWDLIALLIIVALAAIWLTVFAATGLALWDENFSVALRTLLSSGSADFNFLSNTLI